MGQGSVSHDISGLHYNLNIIGTLTLVTELPGPAAQTHALPGLVAHAMDAAGHLHTVLTEGTVPAGVTPAANKNRGQRVQSLLASAQSQIQSPCSPQWLSVSISYNAVQQSTPWCRILSAALEVPSVCTQRSPPSPLTGGSSAPRSVAVGGPQPWYPKGPTVT